MLIRKKKILLEKQENIMIGIQGEFDDIQEFSEISLKKIWMNKKDEIWNQYLKL